MIVRRFLASLALVALLSSPASAQDIRRTLGSVVETSPVAATPYLATDSILIVRGGKILQAPGTALVGSVTTGMFINASNATLPTARTNLGASVAGGIWPASLGGTGVDNTGRTITLSGSLALGGPLTTQGAGAAIFALPASAATFTFPGATSTLASLAGSETLTNKTIVSPALTSIPTAPTAAPGTNTTQLATTAFVAASTASDITALTGDVTATGPGSVAATLATVNANVGSFGSSTSIPSFTVNGKGLITAASGNVVIAPAGTLSGTTLAAGVLTSSLTGVGTVGTGVWQGTLVGVTYGGTGANLSATGGASQVLKQTSAGAAVTVGQLANTDITGLGTMSTQAASAVAITGGTATGLTGLALRDTSAAFNVTIAATSTPTVLSAGRILSLNMRNVAHTLDFGTTENTITFPVAATPSLAALNVAGTWSATQTSMALATATLSGVTTLPNSGGISSAGELGLGVASFLARLHLGGTYTSTNASLISLGGTHASSATSIQYLITAASTIAPSGASLSSIFSLQSFPTLNSTAFTIGEFRGFSSALALGASFTGVITEASMFNAQSPSISGGLITTLNGFFAATQTNGNGITTGAATNRGLRAEGASAAAGAGGTITNESANISLGSGSSAGTTNYGIRITGNGGAASTNFALHSSSTAPFQIGGLFQFLGATSSFPALKRSTTTIQVRLADDSAYGNLDALSVLDSGVAPTGTAGSGYVRATAPTIAGGVITGLTGLAIRDTSAAFDVTLAATSATVLNAGRTLTLDVGNVAHTLKFGTTANTIQFPVAASYTLAALSVAGTWSATQTSMTLSGATLSGATTLPDGGVITSAGEFGLGSTPTGRLHLAGTYTTANAEFLKITGSFASSVTSTQRLQSIGTFIAPSGASLAAVIGISLIPTINTTAFTIPNYDGVLSGLTLGASFSGVFTKATLFTAFDPSISGGSITTLIGYLVNPITNGNGITSGSRTNQGVSVNAFTAAAGAGGTITNEGVTIALGSGSSAGTTNYGIRITGNGGASSSNFALHSSSTAPMQISGPFITMGYTVAGLPATAAAGAVAGAIAYVTNQLTTCAVPGAALTGAGALTCPVFYNGVAWVGL